MRDLQSLQILRIHGKRGDDGLIFGVVLAHVDMLALLGGAAGVHDETLASHYNSGRMGIQGPMTFCSVYQAGRNKQGSWSGIAQHILRAETALLQCKLRFGFQDRIAEIVEDRGNIGVGGRRLYGVKFRVDPWNEVATERPEESLEAVLDGGTRAQCRMATRPTDKLSLLSVLRRRRKPTRSARRCRAVADQPRDSRHAKISSPPCTTRRWGVADTGDLCEHGSKAL